jgi:hypothetical protein
VVEVRTRQEFPESRQTGRLAVLAIFLSLVGPLFARQAFHIYRHDTPDQVQPSNATRGEIEKNLVERFPGRHVIFVRYTGTHSPHAEWIYNRADIDGAPVVWAQDMGYENADLMKYYPGRSFWMFDPDRDRTALRPYSAQ